MNDGSLIIQARLVDACGRWVRRGDLASIEFSVEALDAHRAARQVMSQRQAVDAADVLCHPHRHDWAIDRVGYNFRHRIDRLALGSAARSGLQQVVVRYWITSARGQRTSLCFRLRKVRK